MIVAQITTDNREPFREYHKTEPWFGAAPQALLEGFAELPGVQVHVLSCTQEAMVSPEKLASNIWFHSLHVPKLGWLRTGYQGCIRAVRRKLSELQPDIVHGQGTERECAISAIFSGFPNVVTIHGNMAELARQFPPKPLSYGWLAARLEDFTLPRTQGVFCNSAYTELLVRPRAKRIWRVSNALRTTFFSSAPDTTQLKPPVLLNVGVISERKRQVELIEALRKVARIGAKFRLQFVGAADPTSEYGRRFLALLESPEVREWASYLGTQGRAALLKTFDHASALVHFPSEEAFGLVVAEALARGLKFFGARLGGIVDIAYGLTGADLIEEHDWNGLAEAVRHWLDAGAPRFDEAAKTMRERYHPRVIADRHLEIYREVLSTSK